ncbi:MAG: OsmC family protein [Methanocalculaceae archaeon]|nr:OsmC family protein [Methanocalculaceae archaeon]
MPLNNIDISQVKQYEADIKANDEAAKFTTKMEGTWLFDEQGPQFTAAARTSDKPFVMTLSHPNFNGPGISPSPMSFGLFWIAGCASTTLMTAAEKKGIKVDALTTSIEADLDYHAQFKLGDQPLVGEYRINFSIKTSASDEEIEQLTNDTLAGCMAMYTVKTAVPLKISYTRT